MKCRLRDICRIEKGITGISKAVPGPYPLVTTAEERKQHNEYQFDANAVIIPLVSSTGHGHASINRVHYQEGKFALGTILCAVIPKDEEFLNAKYLHVFLQRFKDSILVPLMKGAANVSLPVNKLAGLEIEVPPLKKQLEIVEQEERLLKNIGEIEILLSQQEVNVSKLRQSILREAMQGKLVAHNPVDEPADYLFQRIIADKEQLASEGELKKGKVSSIITRDEGPYEIPEYWKWVRLGDICTKIGSGSTPKNGYTNDGIPFIRSQNIKSNGLDLSDVVYISKDTDNSMQGTKIEPGDILLNITGGSLGRSALVPGSIEQGNLSQHVCIIRPLRVNNAFIHYLVNSPYFQELIFSSTTGAGRQGLPKKNLELFPIPLPPFPEQERIVAKLEQIMHFCDELEQSIKETKLQNAKLLQQTLLESLGKPFGNLLVTPPKQNKDNLGYASPIETPMINGSDMNIIEILEEAKGPVLVSSVWQKSEYNSDIDKFYEELAKLIDIEKTVVEERIIRDSYLRLAANED